MAIQDGLPNIATDVALAELPVGSTLVIYRTTDGFRIQVHEGVPLRSYDSNYVDKVEQVGDAIMYAIVDNEERDTAATGTAKE